MKPNVYLYEVGGGKWRVDVRHASLPAGRRRVTYSSKSKARGLYNAVAGWLFHGDPSPFEAPEAREKRPTVRDLLAWHAQIHVSRAESEKSRIQAGGEGRKPKGVGPDLVRLRATLRLFERSSASANRRVASSMSGGSSTAGWCRRGGTASRITGSMTFGTWLGRCSGKRRVSERRVCSRCDARHDGDLRRARRRRSQRGRPRTLGHIRGNITRRRGFYSGREVSYRQD